MVWKNRAVFLNAKAAIPHLAANDACQKTLEARKITAEMHDNISDVTVQ